MIYDQQAIAKLGSIMGVWAHPDDESWASGGIMAAAVENRQPVCVLSATNGDGGETADEAKWPKEKLGDIRPQEHKKALAEVGVTEKIMLGYKDGSLQDMDEEKAVQEIAEHIKRYEPTTILTFEEHGITGHPDHKTISKWAKQAAATVDKNIRVYGVVEVLDETDLDKDPKAEDEFNVYFAIDNPVFYKHEEIDLAFPLPENLQVKKKRALRAHESQTSQLFQGEAGQKLIERALKEEHFVEL